MIGEEGGERERGLRCRELAGRRRRNHRVDLESVLIRQEVEDGEIVLALVREPEGRTHEGIGEMLVQELRERDGPGWISTLRKAVRQQAGQRLG